MMQADEMADMSEADSLYEIKGVVVARGPLPEGG